jgi:hypothetical protein
LIFMSNTVILEETVSWWAIHVLISHCMAINNMNKIFRVFSHDRNTADYSWGLPHTDTARCMFRNIQVIRYSLSLAHIYQRVKI